MRLLLSKILGSGPDLVVVGTASDPFVAREKILTLKPDVLTLDIEMPRMDGINFLEKLMRGHPMSVIMISSLTSKGADTTPHALSLGAIDYVSKPKLDVSNGTIEQAEEIIAKVKAAAKAKMRCAKLNAAPPAVVPGKAYQFSATHKIVAVGASTVGQRMAVVRREMEYAIFHRIPSSIVGKVNMQIEDSISYLKVRSYSPATMVAYRRELAHFATYLKSNRLRITQVRPKNIVQYLKASAGKPDSRWNTTLRRMAVLASFFNYVRMTSNGRVKNPVDLVRAQSVSGHTLNRQMNRFWILSWRELRTLAIGNRNVVPKHGPPAFRAYQPQPRLYRNRKHSTAIWRSSSPWGGDSDREGQQRTRILRRHASRQAGSPVSWRARRRWLGSSVPLESPIAD
jgi:DNA-binding NarL/FixJ family response regulator